MGRALANRRHLRNAALHSQGRGRIQGVGRATTPKRGGGRAKCDRGSRPTTKAGRSVKRTRLRSVSLKVRRSRRTWEVVYGQVDARSGGWCEVGPWYDGKFGTYGSEVPHKASEHHHLFKPRRSALSHQARNILHVCRKHHLE